jgi:tRNA(Arg) A34 adenosine deaminase TadA
MSLTHEQDIDFLRRTLELSIESKTNGNHPFGAVLVGPDGETLVESGNTFQTDKGLGHAEANVARIAAKAFEWDFLSKCTLYSSIEPCCMCTGSAYWAGIGSIVFGVSEKELGNLTGDHPENLTMDLPCEVVVAAGSRDITVKGPCQELESEILNVHIGFWN